jgi:hypothetical protein
MDAVRTASAAAIVTAVALVAVVAMNREPPARYDAQIQYDDAERLLASAEGRGGR